MPATSHGRASNVQKGGFQREGPLWYHNCLYTRLKNEEKNKYIIHIQNGVTVKLSHRPCFISLVERGPLCEEDNFLTLTLCHQPCNGFWLRGYIHRHGENAWWFARPQRNVVDYSLSLSSLFVHTIATNPACGQLYNGIKMIWTSLSYQRFKPLSGLDVILYTKFSI